MCGRIGNGTVLVFLLLFGDGQGTIHIGDGVVVAGFCAGDNDSISAFCGVV
jgi:hypothetical protein